MQGNPPDYVPASSYAQDVSSAPPQTAYGPGFDSNEYLYEPAAPAGPEDYVPVYHTRSSYTLPYDRGYASPPPQTTTYSYVALPSMIPILSRCLLNLPDLFFAPPPSTTLTLTPTPITPLCPLLRLSTLAPPPSTGRSPTPLSVPTSASCPSRPATSPRAPSPCSLAAPPRPPRSPIRSRCPPIRRRRSTSTRRCARSPWLLPSPSGSLPPRSRSRSYSSRSSRSSR